MPIPAAVTALASYITACNANKASGTGISNDRNSYWAAGRMAQGPITSTLTTPNFTGGDCDINSGTGMFAARSKHTGGVNVLFTDGSVKFVKNSVQQPIWWSLGTKAGSEVVDASAY
jgi:prepilin-type processing-associated H-X9-DG protein